MPESYGPEQLPGHALFDATGEEIGTIMGVGATYVDVATDPLRLGTHLYVPFDDIAYCTETRCYLELRIDQAHRQQWHQLPEERPSTGRAPAEGQPREVRIPFGGPEPKQRQAGQ